MPNTAQAAGSIHLTDPDGDGVAATVPPGTDGGPSGVVLMSVHENDDWTGCALSATQVRELIAWLSAAIGD